MGNYDNTNCHHENCHHDHNERLKDECLISLKVYDQCRQQDCLTPTMLGTARSAETGNCTIGSSTTPIAPGEIIVLPPEVVSVRFAENNFGITQINTFVEPRRFTCDGYWDVNVEYVFHYGLEFLNINNQPVTITCGPTTKTVFCAQSIFSKRVTLFGSVGSDLAVASNFLCPTTNILPNSPYVWVEAKGMPLDARIVRVPVDTTFSNQVNVTIGLFTIIKLFRLVNLLVKSKGFCKPQPCTEISSDPCEFFTGLDFPFELFNPPQKEDFFEDDDNDQGTRTVPCDEDQD